MIHFVVNGLISKHFSCFINRKYLSVTVDIDECTEMYEDNFGVMQKMHNCDLIGEASCEDTIGSFRCTCGEGFRSQTGSEGQQICASELFIVSLLKLFTDIRYERRAATSFSELSFEQNVGFP